MSFSINWQTKNLDVFRDEIASVNHIFHIIVYQIVMYCFLFCN